MNPGAAVDERSFANGAKTIMRVGAMHQQLRAAGCDTNGGGTFRPVEQRMTEESAANADAPRFEPGKPMMDVSR